jgi:hypothetical protein
MQHQPYLNVAFLLLGLIAIFVSIFAVNRGVDVVVPTVTSMDLSPTPIYVSPTAVEPVTDYPGYIAAIEANTMSLGANTTWTWAPPLQVNVLNEAGGSWGMVFSLSQPVAAFDVSAPIYYEYTFTPGVGADASTFISAGLGIVNPGDTFTPGLDYSLGILAFPVSGDIKEDHGAGQMNLELGVPIIQSGPFTIGLWLDIPNNTVNYNYGTGLKTIVGVTGTLDFSTGRAGAPMDRTNVQSGTGLSVGGDLNDSGSSFLNIGQAPFIHDPTLMPGTVDWFGNVL